MKRLIVIFVALFAAGIAQAQIPNPGFETWSGTPSMPDGWYSTSAFIPGSIQQSGTFHGGSSAARGDVVNFAGFNVFPVLAAGDAGLGFPVSQRYATLSGFYQFTSVGGDALVVTVGMLQAGTVIAGGAFLTSASQSGYAQFDIPIFYGGAGDPDTAYIQIMITDTATGMLDAGSSFLVDDLSLSGITAVGDPASMPAQFALAQNYPNPFNPSTNISFTLATTSFVTLKVFDVLGREVGTLASELLPGGAHTRQWDGSGLPGGVYICRIQAGDFTATRKLVLMK